MTGKINSISISRLRRMESAGIRILTPPFRWLPTFKPWMTRRRHALSEGGKAGNLWFGSPEDRYICENALWVHLEGDLPETDSLVSLQAMNMRTCSRSQQLLLQRTCGQDRPRWRSQKEQLRNESELSTIFQYRCGYLACHEFISERQNTQRRVSDINFYTYI